VVGPTARIPPEPLPRTLLPVYDSSRGLGDIMRSQLSPPTIAPISQPSGPNDGSTESGGWRGRWRRYAAAWMLGVAVVVAPAWPTATQERSARRPPFERALSWRDFIRMRLSPWLLMQQAERPEDFRADQQPSSEP
jgi:hypothetical protein